MEPLEQIRSNLKHKPRIFHKNRARDTGRLYFQISRKMSVLGAPYFYRCTDGDEIWRRWVDRSRQFSPTLVQRVALVGRKLQNRQPNKTLPDVCPVGNPAGDKGVWTRVGGEGRHEHLPRCCEAAGLNGSFTYARCCWCENGRSSTVCNAVVALFTRRVSFSVMLQWLNTKYFWIR